MTFDAEAEKVTFVAKGARGPVVSHGDRDTLPEGAGELWAAVPATFEEHQLILRRLPVLAVRSGLQPENAQALLDLAADTTVELQEAWLRTTPSVE